MRCGVVRPPHASLRAAALVGLLLAGAAQDHPAFAGPPSLPVRHVVLDLPGPPAAILVSDLNADGEPDLVVPVIYSEYEELEFEQAQGFVQITEIVPALFERRELRAWLRRPDGSYTPAGAPVDLPTSVISIEAAPRGGPLVALTDTGPARLRYTAGQDGSPTFVFEPLFDEPPVLRGAGSYIPSLGLLRDLDGAGGLDLLVPGQRALLVHPGMDAPGSFGPVIATPVDVASQAGSRVELKRRYRMPRIEDVDGDRIPDLVFRDDGGADKTIVRVHRGLGGGRFEAERLIDLRCPAPLHEDGELNHFGDLDGDGRAEAVFRVDHEDEDEGLDEAREPHATYFFHHLDAGLTVQQSPYRSLDIVGHDFGGSYPRFSGAGFRDLDGDGRQDLITMTLDFSVMQVLRVLTTKRFGLKMHFLPWVQEADGSFRQVPDQDLSAKVVVDFDDFKLSRLPLFAGDFDGDHALDFVEADGGATIRIRRGHRGVVFSGKPDWELRLEEEPEEAGLLRVADLDADGLSDVSLTRAVRKETDEATSPVKVDLYLSRGAR